jgi:hypothetical protein
VRKMDSRLDDAKQPTMPRLTFLFVTMTDQTVQPGDRLNHVFQVSQFRIDNSVVFNFVVCSPPIGTLWCRQSPGLPRTHTDRIPLDTNFHLGQRRKVRRDDRSIKDDVLWLRTCVDLLTEFFGHNINFRSRSEQKSREMNGSCRIILLTQLYIPRCLNEIFLKRCVVSPMRLKWLHNRISSSERTLRNKGLYGGLAA